MNNKNPRGNTLLVTILLVLPLMLVLAGIAVDLGVLLMTRSELHRTMDAAALAGAGKLAFDSSVFPAARTNAVTYAGLPENKYRFGSIVLDPNTSNNHPSGNWPWPSQTIPGPPGGDVILGIWDGTARTFSPSLDGFQVNAVLCRTKQSLPTYFLNMIGLTSLTTTAESIAISNPPQFPPTCPLPFAPPTCSFQDPTGVFTSAKCGTTVTFTTSSGKDYGPAPGSNSSAWVNTVDPTQNPTPNSINQALQDFVSGNCPNISQTTEIYANNGNLGSSARINFPGWLAGLWDNPTFVQNFTDSAGATATTDDDCIKDKDRNVVYCGKGLKAAVPIIDAPLCPPQAINQLEPITSWAWFVVTQATDNQGNCAVVNPADTFSAPHCATKDLKNTVFGYYDCGKMWGTPVVHPAPRMALAEKLRLVQ